MSGNQFVSGSGNTAYIKFVDNLGNPLPVGNYDPATGLLIDPTDPVPSVIITAPVLIRPNNNNAYTGATAAAPVREHGGISGASNDRNLSQPT